MLAGKISDDDEEAVARELEQLEHLDQLEREQAMPQVPSAPVEHDQAVEVPEIQVDSSDKVGPSQAPDKAKPSKAKQQERRRTIWLASGCLMLLTLLTLCTT